MQITFTIGNYLYDAIQRIRIFFHTEYIIKLMIVFIYGFYLDVELRLIE